MRIFAVTNGRVLDGLGEGISATYTRIHYLLNGLKELGVNVDSIGFDLREGRGASDIIYNNALKTLVALRTAGRLVRQRPLVYFAYPHSMTTFQNRAVFRLCKILGLKTVLDVQDTIEQVAVVGSGSPALSVEAEEWYLRNASLILALNRPMWGGLSERYGLADKMVVLIPNAFEDRFCDLYPGKYRAIDGRFNICYIGGLTKSRGIDILVEACEALHRKHPFVKLYLLGPYGPGLSMGLMDRIDGSDFIIRKEIPRKEIPEALRDMDLLVMPYDPREEYMNRSSPTKLFEYIGTAKPIICTECRSLLDLGEKGIIYVRYDARDIEEKAEELIGDIRKREALSDSLLLIRPLHTWGERAGRLCEALTSLNKGE